MINLTEFLNFNSTRKINLLYPIRNPEKVHINYVSIIEVPVENFIRQNELQLSTALSIRNNPEELSRFIQSIIDSGAAALVFAFPPEELYVLNIIRDNFNDSNFPILISPWNQKFGEIIEETLRGIWGKAQNRMLIREAFVRKLSFNEFTSDDELYHQAKSVDLDTSCDYICILGHLMNHNSNVYERNVIQEHISMIAEEKALSVITSFPDYMLIIFLQSSNIHETLAESFLDSVEAYLQHAFSSYHFAWGYDETGVPVNELGTSYYHAQIALDYCLKTVPSNMRSYYRLSNWNVILYNLCINEDIMNMAMYTLKRIQEYDITKHTNLLETLKCFCQNNYNISETSRTLHLHRQSLLYRLDKIESLTRLSLQNHENLFFLELCIRIYEYQKPAI